MLAAPAASAAQDRHQHETLAASSAPARQGAVVWFMRPVMVGRQILLGQYIIEHDTDRQDRGEPCTHIYAANNRLVPVVTFRCIHLNRPANTTATVTVYSVADGSGLTKLDAFQFAGESAAHGAPTGR
jgi:hypothetical protein